jgi:hypothetical protein
VALWAIVLPAASTISAREGGAELLVRSLRIYDPFQIAVLGVLVLTGASQITDLKELYRESYAIKFTGILSIKLLLSFVVIMLATYQCLGVGHRFVRLYESDESNAIERTSATIKKLRAATILIVPCVAYAVYLGLSL